MLKRITTSPSLYPQVALPRDQVEPLILSARRNERRTQAALFASHLENLANFIKDESPAEIAAILRDQAELYHRMAQEK